MKMNPITFCQRYSNINRSEGICTGFEPYRNEIGEYICERRVVLTPSKWIGGAYLLFTIEEKYCSPITTIVKDGEKYLEGGVDKVRKLEEICIYDYPNSDEYQKIPDVYQQSLMMALALGELRGSYAENVAHDLYVNLFVFGKDGSMQKYLPEVVKFWTDHYNKYESQK